MSRNGVVIITWGKNQPRIIVDYLPHQPFPTKPQLNFYALISGYPVDWVGAKNKPWLREQGFKV